MSLVKQKNTVTEDASELRQTLAAEFHRPTPGYIQPLISITQPGQRTHILVVWDEWKSLSQQERSEIIMRSYEEEYGPSEAQIVSAAMGLTSTEAERLGFELEPV